MAEKAVVHRSGEGQAFWMLGGLYEVLLSSEDTNGATTIMQMTMPAGIGPPPHIHHGVTETVYVADGTIAYDIGGQKVEGGPGSLFRIPAETRERFEATSEARVVVTYEPGGGMDKFFAEAGEPAQRRELPPAPSSPPDVARIAKIGARYGVEIQPPRQA